MNQNMVSQIYLLLAQGMSVPSAEWVEEWNSSEIKWWLKNAMETVGCKDGEDWIEQLPNQLNDQELLEHYQHYFVLINPQKIIPVESRYKTWTSIPGSSLTIAKEKGFLMGDPAEHMFKILEEWQIQIPEEFTSMPDHLCIQLELVSMMEDLDIKTAFIHDHLDWLDDLYKEATEKNWSGFYYGWLQLIQLFVKWDSLQTAGRK